MSRIGKAPIEIPAGVTVSVDNNVVTVKGPKGSLSKEFLNSVLISLEDNVLTVKPADESRFARSYWGTTRSILSSMVKGVQTPFVKELIINGVGFKANLKGKVLCLYLGYSHDINYNVPEGVTITLPDAEKIVVTGVDKQIVGQVAADIKHFYPAEPYKGKGVRIVGEYVRRKEGKKAA